MTKMGLVSLWVPLGALAVTLGCGGGGNGGNGSGNGGSTGATSGGMSWVQDGARHTAMFVTGQRTVDARTDYLQIMAMDASEEIALEVSTPPPLAPGMYKCGPATVERIIVTFTTSGALQTCAIDIGAVGAQSGDHATGTFSATVTLPGGQASTITDGVFDVTLSVTSFAAAP
jgi:hypothetical protein